MGDNAVLGTTSWNEAQISSSESIMSIYIRATILHIIYISSIYVSFVNEYFQLERIQYENKKNLNIILHGGISEESPFLDHNAYFHYPDPPQIFRIRHSFCAQNHHDDIYK